MAKNYLMMRENSLKISSKIKKIEVLYIDDIIKSSKSIKVIQYILKKKKPKETVDTKLAKLSPLTTYLNEELPA